MRFANKIDEFVRQIEQLPYLGSDKDVSLLYHCETENGESVSFPISVETLIIGKGMQHSAADAFVGQAYRQGIIDNIRSLVGGLSDGFMMFRDAPRQVPLKVIDVQLQIK